MRALGAAQPGLTITELGQKLTALAIKAGRSAAGRLVPHLQLAIGLLKKLCPPGNRKGLMFSPSASSGARIAGRDKRKGLDPQRLGCIGETWAPTNMTPRCGRCERGKKLLAYAPFGR
ncbi:MAG: hypothetical protein M3Z96_13850 [Pseudomonadota bacterium]|nr:hypothetical protein [Pseudomonadota bacterium]